MSGPIVIAAGGTGGHMFPALALCRELIARGQRVTVLTDDRGARYVDPDLTVELVDAASPSGSIGVRVTAVARLGHGLIQSVRLFRRLRPAAAASFGGYACVPAAMAAAIARVPLLVHEQNAVFGKANRLVARFARKVATSFAETIAAPDVAGLVSGNPVRPGFGAPAVPYAAPEPEGPIRLLVMGGSQGARILSEAVPAAVAALPEPLRRRLRLAQQCRPEDLEAVRAAYAGLGLAPELAPFFANAADRMAAAHLIVTRSGASTVAELLMLGRPAILIPYPHAADDHQRANAAQLADAGAALMIPQSELTPQGLATALEHLLEEPPRLAAMASAAAGLARPEAARTLADAVQAMIAGEAR